MSPILILPVGDLRRNAIRNAAGPSRNASHSLHCWCPRPVVAKPRTGRKGRFKGSQFQSAFLRAFERVPSELELVEAKRCFHELLALRPPIRAYGLVLPHLCKLDGRHQLSGWPSSWTVLKTWSIDDEGRVFQFLPSRTSCPSRRFCAAFLARVQFDILARVKPPRISTLLVDRPVQRLREMYAPAARRGPGCDVGACAANRAQRAPCGRIARGRGEGLKF
jgi:hypothetical protein